jgi:RND family efflux transporter MFP subunit
MFLLALAPGCDKAKTNEYAPPPPPEVTVAAPLAKSVTAYRVYSGTTEASEVVDIRARVQGFLREVHFQPGQLVKEGDLLFSIEPEEFAARLAQAEAAVSSAQAALDLATVTLEKYEIAFKQGGMTELEVKEKIAARDQAAAAVELAEAQRIRARLDLSYTEIHAPVTGRITKNLIDQGNLVGQGEASLLATIYATTPIFVTVDAPEDVVLQFRRRLTPLYKEGVEPGQTPDGQWRRVELAVADDTGFPHIGRIDFVDPSLDPTTGTLRVRVRFENEDGFLLPGLFSRVRLPGDAFDAILVPEEALNSDQQGRFALVVNAENKVEIRRVETGPMEGSLRVVRSGLTAQDRVIISGQMRARPGATVQTKPGTIEPDTTDAPAATQPPAATNES